MSFQNQVNYQQAPGVEGDFATQNPSAIVPPPEGGFVSGALGATVGRFGWIGSDGRTVQSYGSVPSAPDGFIAREIGEALVTGFMEGFGMTIPPGFPVTLRRTGDFLAKVSGSTAATRGASVYAKYSTGEVTIGSAASGSVVTGAIGSTNTASLGATFTATGSGTTLTATAVTGRISVGDTLGTTTGISAGITIVSQTSGIPNGAGDYQTSSATTISSATATCFGEVVKITASTGIPSIGDTISGGAGFPTGATIDSVVSGTLGNACVVRISDPGTAYTASASGVTTFGIVLNVQSVTSGSLEVGDPITGSNVPANELIASQISGVIGGIGSYRLTVPATSYVASTTITATGGVETGWTVSVPASVGELATISH